MSQSNSEAKQLTFKDRMEQQVAELDEGIARQLNLEAAVSNRQP